MADQNITELPIKTNSGVANTDYMLGIDASEGYQILVRDVAKYIMENYNGSTLAGSAQSAKSAIDALNSNLIQCYRINSGKSVTYNYPVNNSMALIAVSRYRSDSSKTEEVYMADSWGGVAQLVNNTVGDAHTGVAITATANGVTVTNNTSQGAISVIIMSGTHVTAL